MLLSNKIAPNTVITLKLFNGDEIVAKLIEARADSYVIVKPLVLISGPQGLAMTQYIISGEVNNNIELSKSSVMFVVPSRKEMSDSYIQATTGIKIAAPGDDLLLGR
jgi:hypothetical protein